MTSEPRPTAGDWLRRNLLELVLLLAFIASAAWLGVNGNEVWQRVRPNPALKPVVPAGDKAFSGDAALKQVETLVAFGPRSGGSVASFEAASHIQQELSDNGWRASRREFVLSGLVLRTVIGVTGEGPITMLITHYDTPVLASGANATPQGLPGANDGGSGPAILLELARVLEKDRLSGQVWLVFAGGQYNGNDVAVAAGVRDLAATLLQGKLGGQPVEQIVLLDLAGGAEAQWTVMSENRPELAARLDQLADVLKFGDRVSVTPPSDVVGLVLGQATLVEQKIPTVVLADPSYPYWRKPEDTPDRLSADSLGKVGLLLQVFLQNAGNS